MSSIASAFISTGTLLNDEPAGTLARSIPRRLISNVALTGLNTTGQVAVCSIPLPSGLLVSNIAILSGNTAAVAPTHFWMALCDVNLNVLAVTADQLTAAIPINTLIKVPVVTPVVTGSTALYYVACSSTATTTAPNMAGGPAVGSGSSTTPTPFGTAGTQSTPPTVAGQLNGGTVTASAVGNFAVWLS